MYLSICYNEQLIPDILNSEKISKNKKREYLSSSKQSWRRIVKSLKKTDCFPLSAI
jgi:hypothetical protein